MEKTKLQQLADALKAADTIANELVADPDHGRSPLIGAINTRIDASIIALENHATWLTANPLPKADGQGLKADSSK